MYKTVYQFFTCALICTQAPNFYFNISLYAKFSAKKMSEGFSVRVTQSCRRAHKEFILPPVNPLAIGSKLDGFVSKKVSTLKIKR